MNRNNTVLFAMLCLVAGCSGNSGDTATPEAPMAAPPQTAPTPEPEPEPEPQAEPIPAGFHALNAQIAVPDVDAAVDFYGKAFGAQKMLVMPGPDGKTLHAEVKIGDSIVMVDIENEGLKAPSTIGGTPAALFMYVPDVDATVKTATEAGATVVQPVEEQFWGDKFGEVTDPFGHRWEVATHVVDLTDEQMQQRAEIAMADMVKAAKKKSKKEPAWKKIAGTPAKVAVPEEYNTVTVTLVADDAAKAIEFYKAAFGATEKSKMPMADGRLMHAEVQIGDSILMLSDEMPEMGAKSAKTLKGSPVALHHYVTDVDSIFAKAKGAGAGEVMPVTKMFWGDRYGAIVDPAGFVWGIATHVEDVTPEEMQKRMKTQGSAS